MSLVELPPEIVERLEREVEAEGPDAVLGRARTLSARYREHGAAGGERFVRTRLDALAYAALLLPQAHAQCLGALRMVPRRTGDWAPATLLDLGSGPGTATWAAASIWPDLSTSVACERESVMIEVARQLARAGSPGPEIVHRQVDVVREGVPAGRHDLVVLSLLLGELEPRARRILVAEAWRACDGVLVVVEPGTPAAFDVVRAARDQLIALDGRVLAPCPHERDCPMPGPGSEDDWCHFAERLQRPALQRRAKRGTLGWEDAKFSFVAVSRHESLAVPWARVLREPRKLKGRVALTACTTDGLERALVPKSRGDGYRLAKKLAWGSAVEAREDIGAAASESRSGSGLRPGTPTGGDHAP